MEERHGEEEGGQMPWDTLRCARCTSEDGAPGAGTIGQNADGEYVNGLCA